MVKIFDVHTHTYPEAIAARAVESLGNFYEFNVEGEGTYAHLSSQAAENNVRGYLLFSVATNAHQVEKVNDSIAALAAKSRADGFLTVGFAGMHQDFPDFAAEIDRAERIGLRGVKIHPDIQGVNIDDVRMMRLYELLEGRMPVYFHIGDNRPEYQFSSAERLVRVLERFPNLEVVAAHLGGYKSWDNAEKYLVGRPNVWYDTSSSLWAMTPERATDLIRKLGTDRVMFGTDYPVMNTKGELARFARLDLTDTERQAILWDNAVRFLHLEESDK